MLLDFLIINIGPKNIEILKYSELIFYGILPFSELDDLGKIILFFQLLLNLYIVYTFYIYEYNNSGEFLFLRIAHNKRNLYKLCTLLLFVFMVRSINFIFITIIFNSIKFSLIYYLKSVFIYILFSLLMFICVHLKYVYTNF